MTSSFLFSIAVSDFSPTHWSRTLWSIKYYESIAKPKRKDMAQFVFFVSSSLLLENSPEINIYCETHKSVNTKNIYGMLLCCEEVANKA